MMYHFTSISHGFYMILQHLRSVPIKRMSMRTVSKKHPMRAMVPLLHRARAPSWPTGSLPMLPNSFQSCALQRGRSCTATTPPSISSQIWSNTLGNFIELLTTKRSRIIKNTSSCLLVLQKTSRDYKDKCDREKFDNREKHRRDKLDRENWDKGQVWWR